MNSQMNLRTLQISNIATTFFVFIINILASRGIINNKTTGELSNNLPNLFVPSGITFSIWGIIYLLLLFFILYQAKGIISKKNDHFNYLKRIGWFFVLSNIFNSAWIFTWHYELVPLSLVIMILLLISLIIIYLRINIGILDYKIPFKSKFFFQVPFSVYLGWITVATIANVTAVLVWWGVEPFNQIAVFLTVLIICVATLITILVLLKRSDIVFSSVIIWALIGIIVKRLDPRYYKELTVASTAGIATIIIFTTILVVILQSRKGPK